MFSTRDNMFHNRREFLRIGGGLAIAGLSAAGWARAENSPSAPKKASARSCILIYLLGGPPHLDMWDLKPDAPAEIRGPFRPIDTTLPGVRICEHLPRLAQLAHRYALVRSVSYNNNNHTPMIYYTLTGRMVEQPLLDNDVRPPQRTDFPHLGGVLAHFKRPPSGLPGYVAVPELAVRSSLRGEFKRSRNLLRGGGGGFLGPLVDPLGVNGDPGTPSGVPQLSLPADVPIGRLERRMALLSVLDHQGPALTNTDMYRDLRDQAVVLSGAVGGGGRAFSIDAEPPRLRDLYGRHRFGNALVLARRLAEAGVPMIAVHFNEMTDCDGWDLHSNNFKHLGSELLPMVDQGLSALIDDLHQRGLLEQTLVVVMGEFGRSPRINKDAGRDHWGHCQSVLIAGGGIKAGQVYGSSDTIGAYPKTFPVDPVDIHATVYHCMGVNPEQTITDQLHRPHTLCMGRVIQQLV